MTEAEDKKRGVLTVDLDYLEIGQDAINAQYMLQKFMDTLDMARCKKRIERINRRRRDRRK